MTEELKPHQIAQLVNKLRDIATKYHAHGCLRELISREVVTALTQRPAAQTEREAFESAALAKWGQLDFERSEVEPEMYYNQRLDDAWIGFGFAVAWLRASLPAAQQATPEPLGEPFGYFRALPFGWEQCGEHDDGAVALYHRPAPGVPDGLEDQIMEALRDGLSVCMSVSVSRDRKISRDGCTLYAQTEEWCRWLDAEVGPKIRAAVDALAAAQAKGGEQ